MVLNSKKKKNSKNKFGNKFFDKHWTSSVSNQIIFGFYIKFINWPKLPNIHLPIDHFGPWIDWLLLTVFHLSIIWLVVWKMNFHKSHVELFCCFCNSRYIYKIKGYDDNTVNTVDKYEILRFFLDYLKDLVFFLMIESKFTQQKLYWNKSKRLYWLYRDMALFSISCFIVSISQWSLTTKYSMSHRTFGRSNKLMNKKKEIETLVHWWEIKNKIVPFSSSSVYLKPDVKSSHKTQIFNRIHWTLNHFAII